MTRALSRKLQLLKSTKIRLYTNISIYHGNKYLQLCIFVKIPLGFSNKKYNFSLLRFFNPIPYLDGKEGNTDIPPLSHIYG